MFQLGYNICFSIYSVFGNKAKSGIYQLFIAFMLEGQDIITNHDCYRLFEEEENRNTTNYLELPGDL